MLLAPWVFDLLGQRGLFRGLLPSLLWGSAVAISLIRGQTRDAKLNKVLGLVLIGLLSTWFLLWLSALVFGSQADFSIEALASNFLVWTHAGLLAAAGGAVLVLGVFSALWLFQNRSLRQSSWDRRTVRSWMPSLEASEKASLGALRYSFIFWGIGFFLAILNALSRTQAQTDGALATWYRDPKVILTAGLWILLVGMFQASQNFFNKRRLFIILCVASWIFLFVFLFLLNSDLSRFHSPVGWWG